MKLLKRLAIALKYDFDGDFIVYSIPDQSAVSFLYYEDAKKFSTDQKMYRPKVMIGVRKS